jgi:hypothetical protein
MGDGLQQTSAGLIEKVSEARASLREEHAAGQDRLRRVFEECLQAFGTVHMPRVAMADLLIELGMKVRGANGASHAGTAPPAPVPGEAPAPAAETEAGAPRSSAPPPVLETQAEVLQAAAQPAPEAVPVVEPEAAAAAQDAAPLRQEQTPAAEIVAEETAPEEGAARALAALDPLEVPVEQVEAHAG